MRIDVIIDTICPWCFIGKRRLDSIIADRPYLNFEVIWHPFLLNPEIPSEGLDYKEHINNLGGKTRFENINNAINQTAENLNIKFNFSQIKRTPNTLDSHRIIKFASDQNLSTEILEAIYQNYFLKGADIGDRSILIKIGEEVGLDSTHLQDYLCSDKDVSEILAKNRQVCQLGISGIPTFIFGQNFSISGIQNTKILQRMLTIADGNLDNIDQKNGQGITPSPFQISDNHE